MRIFRKIDQPRQEQLKQLFKGLHELYVNNACGPFSHLSVSFFDHWLSREEADKFLCCTSQEEINQRNQLHFKLLRRIVSETDVLSFRIYGRRKTKVAFREFVSGEKYLDYVRPIDNQYSYQGRFWIALPQIEAIYLEGYDDTNHLYYLNEGLLDIFKNWVAEAGLHTLKKI